MKPNQAAGGPVIASATLRWSCVQNRWAKPLSFILDRMLRYIASAANAGSRAGFARPA